MGFSKRRASNTKEDKHLAELNEAMKLYKEQEKISRELGDKAGLKASLGKQALILKDRGELDEAMRLYKEKERICRELGDKAGLQRSLGNQANILCACGELDEAMRLYKEKERICRELGDEAGLATSLVNQALVLIQDPQCSREALALAEEAYSMASGHGYTALAQQIKPILDNIRSACG